MSESSLQILIEAVDRASAPIAQIQDRIGKLEKATKSAGKDLKSIGGGFTKAGQTLGAATVPLIAGLGIAAKASMDFNSQIANVGALGIAQERLIELKGAVQDLAIETGTSTTVLGTALYDTISAFGDTGETMGILEVNTMAASAGLASVSDAILLTSSVTKGYGDTSLAAQKATADMALQTVTLGQTTFPELAGAIGSTIPVAAALGITQEEMFATMATGTGVLGSASEVATKTTAAMSALMAPSKGLSELYEQIGVKSGAALIEQEGFAGALQLIVKAADDAGVPLANFIGSVEGQTLALSLAGNQADAFTKNLDAMKNSAGTTTSAMEAQTQGVNKAGFAMKQAQARMEVMSQNVGDALAPGIQRALDAMTPLVDKFTEFAEKHPDLVAIAAAITLITAAISGLLILVGSVLGALAAIKGAFAGFGLITGALAGIKAAFAGIGLVVGALATALGLPVIAVVALVAGLIAAAVAIVMHWSTIKQFFSDLGAQISQNWTQVTTSISNAWSNAVTGIGNKINQLKASASSAWSDIRAKAQNAVNGMAQAFQNGVGRVRSAMTNIKTTITSTLSDAAAGARAAATRIVTAIADGIRAGIGAVSSAASAVAAAVKSKLPNSPVPEGPLKILNGTHNAGYKISQMVAGGMQRGTGLVGDAASQSVSPVAMAASAGTGASTSSTFAPNVTINVNGGGNPQAVGEEVKRQVAELFAQFQQQQSRQNWLSYS